MSKFKLKTIRADRNAKKTIKECYEEYMDYCKSIGQRGGTLNSKEKFCKYELVIIVNLDDSINFLLGTGCRSTTLLNVKVKDIDFSNKSILFRHMNTKKQVTVILSKILRVLLNEYIAIIGLK